jgi:hypothetical protein
VDREDRQSMTAFLARRNNFTLASSLWYAAEAYFLRRDPRGSQRWSPSGLLVAAKDRALRAQPTLRPKTAFLRLPPVHRAILKVAFGIDLTRLPSRR